MGQLKMSFWRRDIIQPALDHEVQTEMAEQLAILAREPNNPRAHFALGTLNHFQGLTDEAIALYHRAIELDTSYAAPHVSLGRIWAIKGMYEKAWRHAREAEQLGDRSLVEQLERYSTAEFGSRPKSLGDEMTRNERRPFRLE
jgi:tetratricopeptide (TPR) repeat protein